MVSDVCQASHWGQEHRRMPVMREGADWGVGGGDENSDHKMNLGAITTLDRNIRWVAGGCAITH